MERRGRLRQMGRATRCTIAAVATISLLAMPTGAVARPGDEVRPRSLHLTMSATGTRGYGITVDTLGHHRVTLTVSKNGRLASYTTRGKVSRHRVKADFGRFGKVALRFHGRRRRFPRRAQKRSKPRAERIRTVCRGRRPQREVGRFHGTIEFDGQHGYTRLAVGKLRGEVRRSYRQVCRQVRVRKPRHRDRREAIASAVGTDPFGFNLTLLSARSRVGHSLTRFTAISLEPPRGIPVPRKDLFSIVTASLQEKVGRVRVYRSAMQLAPPARVRISRRGVDPATARLALDSPFSGRAHYKAADDGAPTAWTGSLGVRLLGSGLLPLTGPHFHAVLCRVSAFNPRRSCFRRAEGRAARASAALRQ